MNDYLTGRDGYNVGSRAKDVADEYLYQDQKSYDEASEIMERRKWDLPDLHV